MIIKIKKLHPEAVVIKKEKGNSGYDLYASPDFKGKILEPGDIELIPTGIAIEIPEGFGFILKERGSTGSKGLALRCGIVDASYRGEIFVCINNTSNKNIFIGTDEQAAQYSNNVIFNVKDEEIKELQKKYINGESDTEILKNKSFVHYNTKKAIAQGLIVNTIHANIEVVEELSETERGNGKLGSSGK